MQDLGHFLHIHPIIFDAEQGHWMLLLTNIKIKEVTTLNTLNPKPLT